MTRLKAAGIDLAAMGDAVGDRPAGDPVEELTFADPARGTYARLRIRDERLTGAILLGDNPAVGTVVQLFDRGARSRRTAGRCCWAGRSARCRRRPRRPRR
ncbi:hypothetical protein [Micromonospora sp. R77]|uniref:hypothetical protein n=1 Tax=Micromonospora sp. R77 TaxID=2925836 RepID=UPI0035B4C902